MKNNPAPKKARIRDYYHLNRRVYKRLSRTRSLWDALKTRLMVRKWV